MRGAHSFELANAIGTVIFPVISYLIFSLIALYLSRGNNNNNKAEVFCHEISKISTRNHEYLQTFQGIPTAKN